MEKTREEMLMEAEIHAEEALKLYRELVEWKKRAIDFAKDELFYFGMTKAKKEKASSPENIARILHRISTKPDTLRTTFRYQDEQKEAQEKQKQDALKKQQQQLDESKLIEEAIIYLQKNGFTLGKDFNLKDAIAKADRFAFNLAVKQKLEGGESYWFNFIGNINCDESCHRWDGVSHRCDCGNRRVSWERDYDFSFKNPSLVAEAY